MAYKVNYDMTTGEPINISDDRADGSGICFVMDEAIPEFQEFLKWNSEQPVPLDLNSTIPVIPPEPARDVLKELDIAKADIEKLKEGKVDKI